MKATMTRAWVPILSLVLAAPGCKDETASPPATSTDNAPPIAAAGLPGEVAEGESVTLDGRASVDPEGQTLSFAWEQISGPKVTLSSADRALCTFVAPMVTGNDQTALLAFELVVTDQGGLVDRDDTHVAAYDTNQAPLVVLEAPLEANALEIFTARAKDCTVAEPEDCTRDADGTIESWAWKQLTGLPAGLSGTDTNEVIVTAPDVSIPDTIELALGATDAEAKTGLGTVSVKIIPQADGLGFLGLPNPTVVEVGLAWPPLRVEIRNAKGQRITGGEHSLLRVKLEVQSGTGNLTGETDKLAAAGVASFAGIIYDTVDEDVQLRAFVEGTSISGVSPSIDVVFTNEAPLAYAGADLTVDALSPVDLAGSGSDPDGTVEAYLWTQLAGPPVNIEDDDRPTGSFTAPDVTAPTTLTFELEITDNKNKTDTDTANIVVQPVAAALGFVAPLETPIYERQRLDGVRVEVLSAGGERITGGAPATYDIELGVQTGTGSPANLSGTLAATAHGGAAAFSGLRYLAVETQLVLEARVTDPALVGAARAIDVVAFPTFPGALGAADANLKVRSMDYVPGAAALLVAGEFDTAVTAVDFSLDGTGTALLATGAHANGFVSRQSSDGTFGWITTFGDATMTFAIADVVATANQGAIVLGTVDGAYDFDPTAGTLTTELYGGADIFLAGLDAGGRAEWAWAIGSSNPDLPSRAALRGTDVVVGGAFDQDDTDFNPCAGATADDQALRSNTGGQDAFVALYDGATLGSATACDDPSTPYEWVWVPVSSAGNDIVNDVIATADGSTIYAAGSFSGTSDFGDGSPLDVVSGAVSSAFIVALDASDGRLLWVKAVGGDALETSGNALALDLAGNLFVAGTFAGNGDFDPGAATALLSAAGSPDGWAIGLSASGVLLPGFPVSFGGTGARVSVVDATAGLAVGEPLFFGGWFTDTVDFDPGAGSHELTTLAGSVFGFLLAMDTDGTFVWAHGMGLASDTTNDADAAISAITVGDPGTGTEVIAAGRLGDNARFDIELGSLDLGYDTVGSTDAFIGKVDVAGHGIIEP